MVRKLSLAEWSAYDDELALAAGLTFRQNFAVKQYAAGNLSRVNVDTNRTLMCTAAGKKLKMRALTMRKRRTTDSLHLSPREIDSMKRYAAGTLQRLPLRIEISLKNGGYGFVRRMDVGKIFCKKINICSI
jgi:hypothetical protein